MGSAFSNIFNFRVGKFNKFVAIISAAVLLASSTLFTIPASTFAAGLLPAPTLISPADNSVKDGTVLTMDWSDVTDAAKYEYNSFHDAGATSLRYSAEYVASEKSAYNVPDATFWWRVRAIDSTDIPGEWSELFKVTVDNTAPYAEITNPSAGDTVSGVVDVRGTATDANLRGYRAGAKVHGTGVTVYDTGFVPDTSGFTDSTLFSWDTTGLVDGQYRLILNARDQVSPSNNKTRDVIRVNVDNPPAMPTGMTIYEGAGIAGTELKCTGITNGTKITVDWDDNTEADLAGYWYGWDNASVTNEKGKWIPAGTSQFTGNITPGNNPYNYTVIAVDTAGNESPKATCGPFTLDQDLPSTADPLTTPVSGSYHKSPIKISGSSTDNVGVDSVNLYYRDAGTSDPWMLITNVDNPSNDTPFDWSYDWTPSADGTYDIKAAAVDNAGNEESSAYAMAVVFDTTKPSVSIGVFTPSPYSDHAGNFEISGLADDDLSGIDFVRVRFRTQNPDGSLGSTIHKTYFASYDSTTKKWVVDYNKGDLPDGEYGMIIVARDNAGNANWTMRRFQTIDTVGPDVEIKTINGNTPPTDPEIIKGTFDISGTAMDSGSGLKAMGKVVFTDIDTNAKFKYFYPTDISWDGSTKTWSLTVPEGDLPDGTYKVKAVAYDKALNKSKDKFKKIIIDNTRPDLTVIAPDSDTQHNGDITIHGTVTDNLSGMEYVRVRFRDSAGIPFGPIVKTLHDYTIDPSTGEWSVTYNKGDLPDGIYSIIVVARDNAKNVDFTWRTDITIDTTAPVTMITNIADGDTLSGVVDIEGIVTDAFPDALSGTNIRGHRFVIRDLSTVPALTFAEDTGFVPSGEIDPAANIFTWDTTTVADGDYRFNLRGVDWAGNDVNYRIDVTVDNSVVVTPTTPPATGGSSGGTGGGSVLGTNQVADVQTTTLNSFSTAQNQIDSSGEGEEEGDVSGVTDTFAQTSDELVDPSIEEVEECFKILGICWYWWLLTIPVIAILWYVFGRREEEDEK